VTSAELVGCASVIVILGFVVGILAVAFILQ
jgi:hypothetical protein